MDVTVAVKRIHASLTIPAPSPVSLQHPDRRALQPWAASSVVSNLDLAARCGQNAIIFLSNGRPANKASPGARAFPPWAEAE